MPEKQRLGRYPAIKESQQRYRAKNLEKINAKNNEYSKQYRIDNLDACRVRAAKYAYKYYLYKTECQRLRNIEL